MSEPQWYPKTLSGRASLWAGTSGFFIALDGWIIGSLVIAAVLTAAILTAVFVFVRE